MATVASEEIQRVKLRFGIVGNSPELHHALAVAIQVAATDMTVLITGESGSGKESFSKIIHNLSHRKHNNFIAINCGAIPEGTIDSELFGHEKGAFTGAMDARKGYFEVTDGGTIFLDEIGEMPLGTQARLLRILENGEYIKVGSSKILKTDVRVVAATNVNLIKAVEDGKFREDLYYRLNTVPIFVPPLRKRGNDLLLLFRKFAVDYAERYGGKPVELKDQAKDLLQEYSFPGNIRQLKNLVDQISLLEQNREISAEQLRYYLKPTPSSLPALINQEDKRINEPDRELIYKILFELRHDVTELKKLIFQIVKDKRFDTEILNEHSDLFEHMGEPDFERREVMPFLLEHRSRKRQEAEQRQEEYDQYEQERLSLINLDDSEEEIEDIDHEPHEAEEVLSLEELEKEAIAKALRKNNNKRKNAAKDLGISERTLYRKIKQYDLE